jgi:hypothetical protein
MKTLAFVLALAATISIGSSTEAFLKIAEEGQKCSADYGESVPCCGQPNTANDRDGNVTNCSENYPICQHYIAYKRWGKCTTEEDQDCTADYGESVPCCGQPNTANDKDGNVKACSEKYPICKHYLAYKRYGKCMEAPTKTNKSSLDLEDFATKSELRNLTKRVENLASKTDLDEVYQISRNLTTWVENFEETASSGTNSTPAS